MDQAVEAFWWPGMHEKLQRYRRTVQVTELQVRILKHKNRARNYTDWKFCPNKTKKFNWNSLVQSNLEHVKMLDILVAIDRFSKGPTAHICKNTDTRTVLKFLTKDCSDNGTPRTFRTDNGKSFESKDFKEFRDDENIKSIRCTQKLHTGTGLVERTIGSIKSLPRAKLEDGKPFEESVLLAIRTISHAPHNTLKLTPIQVHLGWKPGTAITNLNGQSSCLPSNWNQTLTKYNLAQWNCKYSQSMILMGNY